jgi:hypothetical protein
MTRSNRTEAAVTACWGLAALALTTNTIEEFFGSIEASAWWQPFRFIVTTLFVVALLCVLLSFAIDRYDRRKPSTPEA